MASPSFFNLCGSPAHFAAPVPLHDYRLMGEELMQLAAGADNTVGTVADDHQAWQCGGGGNPPPAPGEQQGVASDEPHRDALGTRKRRDRAKTIVLERKRRVRMQEKLYELRALVPNITKMDKASIIADAVVYVKSLQAHAMKITEEVAALEAPPRSSIDQEPQDDRQDDAAAGSTGSRGERRGSSSHGARVKHVGATRVGEGRFFVTIECERRDGVAAPLCAAVESLESSSLGRSGPDRVVSTFTLKATCQVEAATIGEGTVKLLMMAALGEEGFTIVSV